MSEKSSQITSNFKPPKSPLECLNIHLPSIDKSDSQKDDISDGDDEVTNVYMHIYSAEGREYTSYTTFHGMIRIFNSSTWPSVLFWCLLVLTCVVFYIYYSGSILGRYFKKHTYQETNYLTFNTFEFSYPMIFICPSLPYSLKSLKDNNLTDKSIDYLNTLSWRQSEFDFEKFKIIDNKNWTFDELRTFQKLSSKTCYEIVSRSSYGKREINVCADSRQVETINGYCLLLNLSKSIINAKTDKAVRLILKNHDTGGYRIYVQSTLQHLITSNFFYLLPNRKISLYATLRNSSFLTPPHGGNCISNWTDTNLGKYFNINPQLPYSRKVCEHLKFSKAVVQKHDCIPSHMKQIIKSKFPICNVFDAFQLNFSSEVSEDKCYLECQRKRFIYSKFGNHPIKIWNGIEGINKNISLLEMSFSSRIYQKRAQVKMLQTVDVLSRIGGNTSLFFGFSCLFTYQPPPPEDLPKLPTIIYNKIKQPKSRDSVTGEKEEDGRREGFFSAETMSQKREKRKVSLRPAEDTISEEDEGENPESSISKKKPLNTSSDEPAITKRRQFARDRFRYSIYTMTHEQSQRVKEPCYGFRASIDNTSLSGPLHTNRASIISFGQHRTSNPRVRIVMENPQRRRPSTLTRYDSAIGNF